MFTKPVKKALAKLWMNHNDESATKVLKDVLRATTCDAEEFPLMRAWSQIIHKSTPYEHEWNFVEGMINGWEQERDDESWKIVIILEGNDLEEAYSSLYHSNYSVEGYSSHYAGQPYANPMHIKQVAHNRILVTQWGGLDV